MAWTVTHEEVFRESREYCQRRCRTAPTIAQRKFFYLFTCEYCFSHYVTAGALFLTGYKLLMDNWQGYVLAFFAVVWVANVYMSLFGRLRVDIRSERAAADAKQKDVHIKEREIRKKEKEIEHLEVQLQQCLPEDKANPEASAGGKRPTGDPASSRSTPPAQGT